MTVKTDATPLTNAVDTAKTVVGTETVCTTVAAALVMTMVDRIVSVAVATQGSSALQ